MKREHESDEEGGQGEEELEVGCHSSYPILTDELALQRLYEKAKMDRDRAEIAEGRANLDQEKAQLAQERAQMSKETARIEEEKLAKRLSRKRARASAVKRESPPTQLPCSNTIIDLTCSFFQPRPA